MKTYVICGLGFGDEGKGHTVAWLTRKAGATTIIRYNGGPQAGHNVVRDGKRYLFSQFGSGMAMAEKVRAFLSRQMVIAPFNLLREAAAHEKNGISHPLQRISIDCRCPVVTIWHKILNRAGEISRGDQRLGTVGLGVGETFKYLRSYPDLTITAGDLVRAERLSEKVEALYEYIVQALQKLPGSAELSQYMARQADAMNPDIVARALARVGKKLAHCIIWEHQVDEFLEKALSSVTVLEGAQGTLLDYELGTKPYVTSSCTRCCEATRLLGPYLRGLDVSYIGVSRPYAHRHGPGPLPTEEAGLESVLCDQHNVESQWQGKFRVGWFDGVLATYARELNPELDYVVVTNLDRLSSMKTLKLCIDYEGQRVPSETFTEFLFRARPVYERMAGVDDLISRIEEVYRAPILAISAGEEGGWTQRQMLHQLDEP